MKTLAELTAKVAELNAKCQRIRKSLTEPDRTLTDHLIRVDEILAREFPQTPSHERIRIAIEITGALKWGAL